MHHNEFVSLRHHLSQEEIKLVAFQLDYIAKHGENLSEFELDLLISIERQFKSDHSLSEKQMKVIERSFNKC